ncbi:MAG: amidohydrolase [Zestosphaera tikiterensis]|uniref:Amidohydrolase n=1 Tax=Zestosphaera tikiterensis TaxID=1973259 RepID=A0A2R7Y5R6_9CREN|nr:MAG: amidohydrolase [Zestosphaera tikiterensis]
MNGFALINGTIYTAFKPVSKVDALVVFRDRVLYTGSENVALNISRTLNMDVVDLKGRVVIPGFIDAHMHLDGLGSYLTTLDLRGVRSVEELKLRLRRYAESAKTTWILGRGWDQELFKEKRFPTRWDLDEVVNDKPVVLTRVCGHAAVLNTKAMVLTGLINSNSPDVLKDPSGSPSGVVVERALDVVREKIKESLTYDDFKKLLTKAMIYAASNGVTTVGFVSADLNSFKTLQKLEVETGRLPVRVRVYLNPEEAGFNVVKALEALGIVRGFGTEYVRLNGIKIFVDGSLGARTAWLSQPYADADTVGVPILNEDSLLKLVNQIHDLGLQIAIHGIGDKAVETILNVYERLEGVQFLRHRIEHASVLRPDILDKLVKVDSVVVVQPHFIITDWWVVNRLGDVRAQYVYAFKTLLKSGVKIAFSTDSPVEPLNPWDTIYAAVTRGKYENIPLYELTKHECLSVEEALYSYTEGSAYALFEEKSLGSLEQGMLADFIVVDKDPLKVGEKELKEIKVLETYTSGLKTYDYAKQNVEGLST